MLSESSFMFTFRRNLSRGREFTEECHVVVGKMGKYANARGDEFRLKSMKPDRIGLRIFDAFYEEFNGRN
jgi:hypothetical protein